jgi:hypothetical protein
MGPSPDLDAMVKKKNPCPCRISNPCRPDSRLKKREEDSTGTQ